MYRVVVAWTPVFAALVVLSGSTSLAQEVTSSALHPLRAADTSSPRATLNTFIAAVDEVYDQFHKEGRSLDSDAERQAVGARILRCLDLSKVPESVREGVGREKAACLKEVLDRLDLPPTDQWPDLEQVAAEDLTKWMIPGTEISIVKIAEGAREGEFLFSHDTVDRVDNYYELVKEFPYQQRSRVTPGLYQLYLSEPGWLLPRSWIYGLPSWAHLRWGGQAVWQWFVLICTLLAGFSLMLAVYLFGRRRARDLRSNWLRYAVTLIFPIAAMLIPVAALGFLEEQVRISGTVLLVISYSLRLLFMLALIIVLLGAGNRLAALIIATPWIKPRGLDAQWVRLVCRIGSIVAAVLVFLEGGQRFGIPLTTLVASAGVGGLAVALAAQDTLKNVFGSIMVTLDKPYQVGERIVVKGYDGFVEQIGLRSTRLRLLTGHQVSIPNDDMARSDIENIGRRRHIRGTAVIQIPSQTPVASVKRALEIVREALRNHEGMSEEYPPRVFLRDINEASTGIVLFYWYHPPEYWKYLEFTETLYLGVMEQFEAHQIPFAQPAMTVRMASEGKQDDSEE